MSRTRMIVDLSPEVQMAIKLRAVKSDKTTGQVVAEAIKKIFPHEIEEAMNVLGRLEQEGVNHN